MDGPLKWQWIKGFPGYMVSSVGGRVKKAWMNQMKDFHTRELKPDIDKRGRRRFALCRNGAAKKILVSRLVLESFVGPCPDGMEACHENGDCTNNDLTNLRWDTHSSNLLDRRRHGTNVQGEMVNTSKITEADVRTIRMEGYPLKKHAEKYGISETMVSLILRRKAWQHVA